MSCERVDFSDSFNGAPKIAGAVVSFLGAKNPASPFRQTSVSASVNFTVSDTGSFDGSCFAIASRYESTNPCRQARSQSAAGNAAAVTAAIKRIRRIISPSCLPYPITLNSSGERHRHQSGPRDPRCDASREELDDVGSLGGDDAVESVVLRGSAGAGG